MDLSEIMIENVITIQADATVKEAVKLMNEYEIGCLIVAKKREVVGIVTERDILARVVSQSKNPEMTSVSEIMSQPIIFGIPEMYVEDAAKLMFRKNIKKLPILKDGHLVGLVTVSDIARVAHVERQVITVIKELIKKGWLPPKRMKKVVDFYIA